MPKDTMPNLPGVVHSWVDTGAVSIHVAELNREAKSHDRPTLVLLHGWPQNWWCWHKVMPALAADHHVVAIDVRGAGWSGIPDPAGDTYDKRVIAGGLLAVFEAMDLDRPVIVGHDWGGWIAQLVAGRAPASIRGVVALGIVAPWAPIPWYELWRFAYQPVFGGPFGVFAHRRLGQRMMRMVFALGGAPGFRMDPNDLEIYLERYRDKERAAAGRAMYRRFLSSELRSTMRGRYLKPVTEMPLLYIAGRHDVVLTPRMVRRAQAPNVTVLEASDSGHWLPEEAPEIVIDEVLRFTAQFE